MIREKPFFVFLFYLSPFPLSFFFEATIAKPNIEIKDIPKNKPKLLLSFVFVDEPVLSTDEPLLEVLFLFVSFWLVLFPFEFSSSFGVVVSGVVVSGVTVSGVLVSDSTSSDGFSSSDGVIIAGFSSNFQSFLKSNKSAPFLAASLCTKA